MLRPCNEKRRGFTLVELLIVICIIGVIATIAIPILLSSRDRAVDVKAQNSLRAVISAECAFYAEFGYYGDFTQLDASAGGIYTQQYLDDRFAANSLGNGINISIAPAPALGQTWTCTIVGAVHSYSADQAGKIVET
jgi:prepilin-type N-terminal cleavage/methylation domain-containing protein